MGFKVGDKVKILQCGGIVGEIIGLWTDGYFFVDISPFDSEGLPISVYCNQMKLVARKGEQLLFAFMEEGE